MNNKIIVSVKGGKLIATPSSDPNYPGIDIEFIADNEDNTNLSNPRVLVEQPYNSTQIRAFIWNNCHQEDFTKEVELWHPDGENLRVRDDLSDNTMIGIQDDHDKLYEYHTDDDEVVAFSRYEEDPGEVISGPIAEKIRKFGLMQMEQNPNRWEKPSNIVNNNPVSNNGEYKIMKLSECVDNHKSEWNWIANETIKRKEKVTEEDYFEENNIEMPSTGRYPCEFLRQINNNRPVISCNQHCPFVASCSTSTYPCFQWNYNEWADSRDWRKCAELAKKIADCPLTDWAIEALKNEEMSSQEAIKKLKEMKNSNEPFSSNTKAIEMAINALEKEISQVPDFEGDGYDDGGNLIYDTWICPNCGHKYEVEYEEYERCPKCGQAINENAFSD